MGIRAVLDTICDRRFTGVRGPLRRRAVRREGAQSQALRRALDSGEKAAKGYMDAAARIKTDRGTVRDEARKAEVLDNIAREAAAAGLDAERLRAVWNELVEQSIAYEEVRWDRLRADG